MKSPLKLVATILAVLVPQALLAAPTSYPVSSGSWTDLGTGGIQCSVSSGQLSVMFAYGDTAPPSSQDGISAKLDNTAAPAFLSPPAVPTTTNHSWAKLPSNQSGTASIICQSGSNAASAGSSQTNPLWQGAAGSTGTDYSINASTIPASGLSILQTIAANASRLYVEVQNQSANTVQVVRDDGAGNNQTTILLASGGSAGAQGGGWSSNTFKGRVRIYGVTGSQIAAYQD